MPSLFKLKNPIKHYGWGSPEWIPQLLGLPNEGGEPWAELWMGAHPEGPSALDGSPLSLPALIGEDPARCLGEEAAREFGGLPFLFKLIAAARPLSIQAHPNLAQAKAGWERENALGIPLGAPNRNYRDANHKPELLCAISPFTAMAGFRKPREIRRGMAALGFGPLEPLLAALDDRGSSPFAGDERVLRRFLAALFALSPAARKGLGGYARSGALDNAPEEYVEQWKYIRQFAGLYPEDPAVLAPLYLNLVTLQPGEAINIPAGILHSYVHGFGVELMANSDNVLRGGLTPKHVDLAELTAILRFEPFKPEILEAPEGADGSLAAYPSPCREFSLRRVVGRGGVAEQFSLRGPAIVIVLEGELAMGGLRLGRGESAFVAADLAGGALAFAGDYVAYVAGTGLG
jgi:mannose-6-phosphate isomerase